MRSDEHRRSGLGKFRDVTDKPRLRAKLMKDMKEASTRRPTQPWAREWQEGRHPEQEAARKKAEKEGGLGSAPEVHRKHAARLVDEAQAALDKANRKADAKAAARAQSLAARAHAEARGANSGVLQREALKIERAARRLLLNDLQGAFDGGELGSLGFAFSPRWKKVVGIVAGVAAAGGMAWVVARYVRGRSTSAQSSSASSGGGAPAKTKSGRPGLKSAGGGGGGSSSASDARGAEVQAGNEWQNNANPSSSASASGAAARGGIDSGSSTSSRATSASSTSASSGSTLRTTPNYTAATPSSAVSTIRTAVLPALLSPTVLKPVIKPPVKPPITNLVLLR